MTHNNRVPTGTGFGDPLNAHLKTDLMRSAAAVCAAKILLHPID